MSTAKATETASLSSHLDFARNQYLDLVQQQNEKNEIINSLGIENQTLRDQLEYFNNVIELGYNELQKIRNERVENISTLEQLKHIIVCCGQYYADHCNEHERCTRLEQKNRFLNNKILIMENNLEAASEELRNLRISLKHNPYKEKRDTVTRSRQCFGVVCSEYQIGPHQSNFTNLTMTKIELNNKHSLQTNFRDIDLKSHLNTVKKLLSDQDNLIKDLKSLSRVITEESFVD